MYHTNRYRAELIRVIDGDTIEVRVDLGCKIQQTMICRLLGIDAPEKKGVTLNAGKASQNHLTEMLESCKPLIVQTYKDSSADKYGRYLVDIFAEKTGKHVNTQMVLDGFAIERSW